MGGKARAAALTPEERSAVARKGGLAKKLNSLPRAVHKGNFSKEFGVDVDCYVLEDEQHTAVISQRGMSAALGIDPLSGGSLPRFVRGEKIAPYVGGELAEKLSKPLVFLWAPPVANAVPTTTYGYDVTMLIDLCKAIIKAQEEGKLLARQARIARQAQVIVNASAKAGIKGLVYALAGYDATKEEVIAAFKLYVQEEAREYEKEFPNELYDQWYRLYQPPKPEKGKPWKFRALTIGHVYEPLANSSGKVLALTRRQRAMSTTPWKKLHQFLSEIGTKALRVHLGRLTGLAEASADRATYEQHVARVFSTQLRFDF